MNNRALPRGSIVALAGGSGLSGSRWRRAARSIGVGRALQHWKSIKDTGVLALIETKRIRNTLLPRILRAPPICVGKEEPGLKMLLHKERFLDGMWSLYSFLRYVAKPLHVTVHNDGSLDSDCAAALKSTFPGIRIVERKEADQAVERMLNERRLFCCRAFRDGYVHALKLIDMLALNEQRSFVLLDADVLTYSAPHELLNPPRSDAGTVLHMHSVDNNDLSYALPREVMEQRLGHPVAVRLNAGVLHIQAAYVSLDMYEDSLRRGKFLSDPQSKVYYTEQTVYAAVLPLSGAVALDEKRYTICGGPRESVTAHYCGGGYWSTRLYREGIPHLVRELSI